uniref:POU class 6 homeobox 2 n=1 Tax=Hucho hucho TaxID=62062 RepID=A0A4W5R5D1_9TELE
MGSIAGSQVFGNALSNLQAGVTGQLVTNAQGQIIGTIPLMPNSGGPSSQSGGGNPALQVQPITPQLLTNTQGQIIATVIGNQILPVINTQGITLSPIKPGQQLISSTMVHPHKGVCVKHLSNSLSGSLQSPCRAKRKTTLFITPLKTQTLPHSVFTPFLFSLTTRSISLSHPPHLFVTLSVT